MITGHRNIDKNDYLILREFLYQAIYIPPEEPLPEKSVIDMPEIARYISNWDDTKDFGVAGIIDEKVAGVIWGRLFDEDNRGYGFVDEKTPEMSMAVDHQYRNKGLGTELLQLFLQMAKEKGYNRLSLSVDKRNRACSFYTRNGFRIHTDTGPDFIMIIDI